jgi:twitching motility protein PilT
MAAIDGILGIMVEQGANELRLGTGKSPAIFRDGSRKKLSIAETTAETLRHLLGPILTRERETTLWAEGRAEFAYESSRLGAFWVVLSAREPALRSVGQPAEFDVTFARRTSPAPAPQVNAVPAGDARPPGTLDWAAAQAAVGRLEAAAGPEGVHATLASLPDLPLAAGAAALPVVNVVGQRSSLASTMGSTPSAPSGAGAGRAAEARPELATFGLVTAGERQRAAAPSEPDPALARLLGQAAAVRASDVHLRSGEVPTIRVDGRLRALPDEGVVDVGRLLGCWLTPGVEQRIQAGRSADLAADVSGIGRVRVNFYGCAGRLCAAIRLLPAAVPAIAELNLPLRIDDLVDLPHGLVIVCGPTGSGKSSTLAALAQEALRRRSAMLLSLEDPVEYVLQPGPKGSLVRQRQIGDDVRDFPTGLRDALREDPDVLLIGEMRDPETIGLTLTAAETGHLVLTSLHSRSAASALARMTDAYPPERQQQIRVQIADSLRAVVAQRLLPRAAGRGRLPAVEVLRVNHSVANLIREGRTAQLETALQAGGKEGMIPLERCLADLVRSGHVSLEAARAEANDLTTLAGYLQG